jgi:hypothetical protein
LINYVPNRTIWFYLGAALLILVLLTGPASATYDYYEVGSAVYSTSQYFNVDTLHTDIYVSDSTIDVGIRVGHTFNGNSWREGTHATIGGGAQSVFKPGSGATCQYTDVLYIDSSYVNANNYYWGFYIEDTSPVRWYLYHVTVGSPPSPPTIELSASQSEGAISFNTTITASTTGSPTPTVTWSVVPPDENSYCPDPGNQTSLIINQVGTWIIQATATNSQGSSNTTITITGSNPPTPTPTPTPTTTGTPRPTIPITPVPVEPIETFQTFTTWQMNETNWTGQIGVELFTPYRDICDWIAGGIRSLLGILFTLPNMVIGWLTTQIITVNEIGDQVLSALGTCANIVLQVARICLDTLPVNVQLLMIWALFLETVYLILRGET